MPPRLGSHFVKRPGCETNLVLGQDRILEVQCAYIGQLGKTGVRIET